MKKAIIMAIFLVLLVPGALAQLQGEIIAPANDVVVPKGSSLDFLAMASNGQTPYSYSWSFCSSGCSPMSSSLSYVEEVNFTDLGKYMVQLNITDAVSDMVTDHVTVDVRLSRINSPENDSYFFDDVEVDFDGEALGSSSYSYLWDFGSAYMNSAYPTTVEDPQGLVFPEGDYDISLKVTDEVSGEEQTSYLTIHSLEAVNTTVICRTELNSVGCSADEDSLMRINSLLNAHARPLTDPFIYEYIICCEAESLEYASTTNPDNPSIFAKFTDDHDSEVGGAHKTIETTGLMFTLENFEGIGSKCEPVAIGTDGECPGNSECVYEFYPSETERTTAHVAACTDNVTPNAYGDATHAMCCGVSEDCRNNKDDDLNIWFDCVDNDVCTVTGSERPCGGSDNFLHDPTCSWLSAYCDNSTGECDFTSYSLPRWESTENTYAYIIPQPGFELCEIIYLEGSWQAFNCPPGIDQNDIVLPPTTDAAVATVNSQYAPLSTDRYELYAMCRLFHCSEGDDPENPLPEYVPDMENNSYQARHCCPMGTYWDPVWELCQDFSECYDPDPMLQPCNYDYNTEFGNWTEDVYNATNPMFNPQDCVIEQKLQAGLTEDTLCCPLWQGGQNTYDWSDLTYYVQS